MENLSYNKGILFNRSNDNSNISSFDRPLSFDKFDFNEFDKNDCTQFLLIGKEEDGILVMSDLYPFNEDVTRVDIIETIISFLNLGNIVIYGKRIGDEKFKLSSLDLGIKDLNLFTSVSYKGNIDVFQDNDYYGLMLSRKRRNR